MSRTDLRCVEILVGQDTAHPAARAPLGLTSGGVTAMLARLERLGYLVRTADPADGRRVVVRITEDPGPCLDPARQRLIGK
ncbi:MAG: MarR family transcriptional regulator [Actinomycetota bacterium]